MSDYVPIKKYNNEDIDTSQYNEYEKEYKELVLTAIQKEKENGKKR